MNLNISVVTILELSDVYLSKQKKDVVVLYFVETTFLVFCKSRRFAEILEEAFDEESYVSAVRFITNPDAKAQALQVIVLDSAFELSKTTQKLTTKIESISERVR